MTLKNPLESAMLREDSHKEAIQVVETSTQNRKVEKVSRPTLKMGSSKTIAFLPVFVWVIKRSFSLRMLLAEENSSFRPIWGETCTELGLRVDKLEVEQLAEIKKIAAIFEEQLG